MELLHQAANARHMTGDKTGSAERYPHSSRLNRTMPRPGSISPACSPTRSTSKRPRWRRDEP